MKIDFKTEISDIPNSFQEILKQKFNLKSFEKLLACVAYLAIEKNKNYDIEDKNNMKELISEIFNLQKGDKEILIKISLREITNQQPQEEENNLFNSTIKQIKNIFFQKDSNESS